MLDVYVPKRELFNDATQEFIEIPGAKFTIEHSLISVQKWESKWKKSFISNKELTPEEFADYVRCMTIGKELPSEIYQNLGSKNILKIQKYIDDPMTATTFRSAQQILRHKNEIITAELIYYWMIEAGVPFECEKWHLNRLLALIRVCNVKGSSGKKMSKREVMRENAALNAARRKATGSKG